MAPSRSSAATPPGPWLRQILLSISRQAERDLAQLSSRHPQARIHALRVRMKKLRAILRLIAPAVAPTTLAAIRRSLRVLKQAFAMNRDEHVLNALLAELSDGAAPKHETDELPEPAQLHRLQDTARSLTRRLQAMALRPLKWKDVAAAYARRYAQARRWFRRCEHKPSPERLHHWRRPVKDHYFQSLLMLHSRRHRQAARKLASLLGRMHDLAMLSERCDQDSSDRVARVIHRQMKHLQVRIFGKARQLLAHAPGKIARRSLAEVKKRDGS